MDWLTEAPTWSGVALLLMWIKVLEVVAVVLLALALLTLVVGWVRHLSWWVRLSAVVPLVAGIGVARAVPGLHDTYAYWAYVCNWCCGHGCSPASGRTAEHFADAAAHMAAVLGWVGMVVAGLWLLLGLVGFWHLRPPRQRQQALSPAVRP